MISDDGIALKDSHEYEHQHEHVHASHGAAKCDIAEFFGGLSPPLLEEYEQNKGLKIILSNIITTPNSNDSRQFFQ